MDQLLQRIQHPLVVALSLCVVVATFYTALKLGECRTQARRTNNRKGWFMAASITMGVGILVVAAHVAALTAVLSLRDHGSDNSYPLFLDSQLAAFVVVTLILLMGLAIHSSIVAKHGLSQLEIALDTTEEAILIIDRQWRLTYLTPKVEQVLGVKRRDLIGKSLWDSCPAALGTAFYLDYHRAMSNQAPAHFETLYASDASWFEIHAHPNPKGMFVHLRDVTERKRSEAHVTESEQRYKSLFEQNPYAIYAFDLDGKFISLNPACETVCGYSPEELRQIQFMHLFDPADLDTVLHHFDAASRGEPQTYEAAIFHKNGQRVKLSITNVPIVVNKRVIGVYGVAQDITAQKQMESQLELMAFHDPLTQLLNRTAFLSRVGHSLEEGRRTGRHLAVLFLDVDNFKDLNDTLGHHSGDELLRALGERLRSTVPSEAAIARIGGDEFAVLLPVVLGEAAARRAAQELLEALQVPFSIDRREVFTSISLGIAVCRPGIEQPEDMLREAGLAVHHAKKRGKSRYDVYNQETHDRDLERLDLTNDLRRAIQRDELVVYYQPIIELQSGSTVGVEALVRWQHPERGLLHPGEFIPLAEESGLIVPLGRWVLEKACQQASRWHAQGASVLLNVNLASQQFEHPHFVSDLNRILLATGLNPAQLQLEITERTVMHDDATVMATLNTLRDSGVRLAIDDFGTGYSSMSYLKQLPVNVLKIDRSFITGLGSDPADFAIVSAIVSIAKALNLRVTAEGIETPEQVRQLLAIGCDRGQGYYFAKPIPAEELERFLTFPHGSDIRTNMS